MSRNDSIEALNDATTTTSRIDTVLAGQEGLDVDPDITWVPGDPLFDQPYDNDWTGYYQPPVVRCKDCDTNWNGDEPCFICGQEVPRKYSGFQGLLDAMRPELLVPRSSQPSLIVSSATFDRFRDASIEISASMERAGESMRELMDAMWFDVETFEPNFSQFQMYSIVDSEMTMQLWSRFGQVNMERVQPFIPRQYGGNRMLQIILDEAQPPPNVPVYTTVTWEGTTIEIPAEINMDPVIPLPERIDTGLMVREELVHRTYPTSSVVTQERRRRS